MRESSSLSTCKYLYNFSRSISQKTLFLIFQLDLLSMLLFRRNKRVQVFPSETQNALPSFGRERFLRFRSRKRIGAKREGALIRLLRCLGCHSPFGRNGILDILNIAPEGGKNKSIKRRRNRPTKIKIGCQTAPAPLRGLLLKKQLIRT